MESNGADEGISNRTLRDRTSEFLSRDLHTEEGQWPLSGNPRYGAVVFNEQGEVLLREPANHFGGFVWTFAKGGPNAGEHPVHTALREVKEETGCVPKIVGHLQGAFKGGSTHSSNYFYIMQDLPGSDVVACFVANRETWSIRWANSTEAPRLISMSTDTGGRDRDLRTLKAALLEFKRLTSQ